MKNIDINYDKMQWLLLFTLQGGQLTFPFKMEEMENILEYRTVDLIQIQLEQVQIIPFQYLS